MIRSKRVRRFGLVCLLILIGGYSLKNIYIISFRKSEPIEEGFDHLELRFDTVKGVPMRYIVSKANLGEKPLVVFLHGAPGSLSDFSNVYSDTLFLHDANLLAMDRPGYGFSNYRVPMTSLSDQAEVLYQMIERNQVNNQPVILVGHSFGGPIAGKIGAQYAENIAGIALLAAATDPAHEKIFKISYLFNSSWTRWMLPGAWLTANEEKLSHVNELELMKNDWQRITSPVVIVHGDDDGIVPFENSLYVERMLTSSEKHFVTIEGGSHLSPIEPSLMISTIRSLIESILSKQQVKIDTLESLY